MKFFRYVWLFVFVAGLLFVGVAFASDTDHSATSQVDREVAMTLADDCDDELGTSASLDEFPDAALTLGQSEDQACRDCHTNEELLKELAVEEEEAESLSEGPG